MSNEIRKAFFAGQFYPDDPRELQEMLSGYLKDATLEIATAKVNEETLVKGLKALIVPHAGYIYSGPVAASGYALLSKHHQQLHDQRQIENVILIGPSHYKYFQNLISGGQIAWETPLGQMAVNNKILPATAEIVEANNVISKEHSVEVQIPFLQMVCPGDTVTPLVCGDIKNYEQIAALLEPLAADNFFVISSDLSHYHPYAEAQELDQVTIASILANQIVTQEQACGADGINIISIIARHLGWKTKLLDYRNSGDTAGDKDAVVGYCAIAYFIA